MRYLGLFAAAAVIAIIVNFSPIARPQFLTKFAIPAPAREAAKPFVIAHDGGGFVTSYISLYSALKRSGVPVQIAGECTSACTLVFTLPPAQVCAWPEAIFGFHAVSVGSKLDKDATKQFADAFYPEPLHSWFLKTAAGSLNVTYRRATDFFPVCV